MEELYQTFENLKKRERIPQKSSMNNLHQLFEDVRNASDYEEMKRAGNAFYEDYRRALQGKYYAEKLEKGEYSSNTFPNPDYLHAWISANHALTTFSRAGHLTVEEKMKVSELGLNLERLGKKVEEGKIYIPLADRLDIGCHSD